MEISENTYRRMAHLLEGRYHPELTHRPSSFEDLEPQEREAVRDIAAGSVPAEPQARSGAIAALRSDPESERSLKVLRSLVLEGEPPLQLQALRAIPQEQAESFMSEALSLVRAPDTRPDVALAAARTAVIAGADSGIVGDLQELRERLLPLVSDNPRSPSIASVDRMIARVQGELPPAAEQPKPDR